MKYESTARALLGLLSIRPMSGYDIRQMIPNTIGHFWTESYGQIYPALREMTAEGLIEKRTDRQAGRPDRNVYTLIDAGYKRLEQWLRLPAGQEVLRNELLLKLFFGAHVPAEVNREHVRTFLQKQEHELQIFEGIAKFLRKERAGNPNLPYWLVTLNRGRHDAMAAAAWARETLEELDRLEGAGSGRRMDHEAELVEAEVADGA